MHFVYLQVNKSYSLSEMEGLGGTGGYVLGLAVHSYLRHIEMTGSGRIQGHSDFGVAKSERQRQSI